MFLVSGPALASEAFDSSAPEQASHSDVLAMEQMCADQAAAQVCHDHVLMQHMDCSMFGWSLFSGWRLVDDAGNDLAYKRSSTHWKEQACS